jgi:hypothetical protein
MSSITSGELRTLIRSVTADAESMNPRDIAEAVAAKLEGWQLRSALEIVLPDYVRGVITLRSSANRPPEADDETTQDPMIEPVPIGTAGPGSGGLPDAITPAITNTSPRPGVNRNTRAARIAAWANETRRKMFQVGDEHKRLNDCTADDLMLGAKHRQQQAADLQAEAGRWFARGRDMQAHGWVTVADVPDSVLRDWFDRAAA